MDFKIKKLEPSSLNCSDIPTRNCLISCDHGYYTNNENEKVDISDLIYNCLSNTKFYPENYDYQLPTLENKDKGIIEIRNESTLKAAHRLRVIEQKENVCALNFANSTIPGGGVLQGRRAQEETLCRSSALYYSLKQSKSSLFYQYHESNPHKARGAASDSLIYSPDCPTWIVDKKILDHPFLTSFISSAAVDNSFHSLSRDEIKQIHDKRIETIINCAIENGVKNIVLGAFGCGAFLNKPEDIAQSFKRCLVDEEKRFYFETISFSIIGYNTANIDAFAKAFNLDIIS